MLCVILTKINKRPQTFKYELIYALNLFECCLSGTINQFGFSYVLTWPLYEIFKEELVFSTKRPILRLPDLSAISTKYCSIFFMFY